MNFRLDAWCSVPGRLNGSGAAARALQDLMWGLTNVETPQPIGLDLRQVTEVSETFLVGFFVALLNERPESLYGPHPVVAFGASPHVANTLRAALAERTLSLPISVEQPTTHSSNDY